ncbi:hypothetical protein [Brevibacterium sp.]|uniref:hypothetical protein n=1 Tax=Brevibacterium sp. TaxID=1701 RepID=UPI0028112B7A|nr:hypothetical protein [Brevibacterium sp.]
MNTNHPAHHHRHGSSTSLGRAATRLNTEHRRLLGRRNQFRDGMNRHGEAFAAFILGTDVLERSPGDLLCAFAQAHHGSFTCRAEAEESLAHRFGWTDWLGQLRGDERVSSVASLLTLDETAVRNRLERIVVFVDTPHAPYLPGLL